MAGVRIDIGGSDAVSAKIDALNKKLDASEEKLKTIAKESKITEREGKRLWEQTRTPLEKYNRQLDRAKQLAQLAGGDPARFRALQAEARAAFAQGAGATEGEAARLVFQVRSAGAGEELPFFTQLKRSGAFGDVANITRASQALRTSLGPQRAGSFQDVISTGLGASEFNPQAVAALLEASSRAGGSAGALGISSEGLLGATAIAGTAAGSSEKGATRVAALFRQLEKRRGFQGLGIVRSVEELQRRVAAGRTAADVLGGDSEAVQGFRALRNNLPKLREAIEAGRIARASNLALSTAALAEADPTIAQVIATRQARARAEIAKEALALKGLRQQERQANVQALAAGGPGLQQVAVSAAASPFVQTAAPEVLGGVAQSQFPIASLIVSLLSRIADNSDQAAIPRATLAVPE